MTIQSADLLRDVFAHQRWADAEHWRAIEASPAAREDERLRARLHHIHLVQQSFSWLIGPVPRTSPAEPTTPADFPTFEGLAQFARRIHAEMRAQFEGLTIRELQETVSIPFFTNPPLNLTRAEALMQMTMHSQWHRGQNAVRLRELGVTPPTVDLITWYWLGRPDARWTAVA